MATEIAVPNQLLVPGDIIRFDWEIWTDDPDTESTFIAEAKDAVWQHDLLDYQGSEIETVGSLTRGKDVKLLHVFAKVRRTTKAERLKVPEEQQANLAPIAGTVLLILSAGVSVLIAGKGVQWAFLGAAKWNESWVQAAPTAGQAVVDTAKGLFPMLAVAALFWLFFLRK